MNKEEKFESNVNGFVQRMIGWAREHDRSFQQTLSSLCEGTLPEKTAKTLRSILYAYSYETVWIASQYLCEIETNYGPIPDAIESVSLARTPKGYEVNVTCKGGPTMSDSYEKYSPAIYVTTHDKQEEQIFGDEFWVDLTMIENEDDLLEECLDLHSDEEDPWIFIKDHCGIPEVLLEPTGWPDKRIWDWMRLPREQRDFAVQYWRGIDLNAPVDHVLEHFAKSGGDLSLVETSRNS